ncbi:flagellar motor switch protein FliM [Planctomycetes bacterium K23_9]|uniref:Flagellar motor switch protein FliM n=1 Tax=Stieleria marina TaxID=1930275 RepID=A0A517NTZ8_9BACT|nr:Flagellar motor switch protein FliM [Planctomycetes bacterium K23_9]
MSDSLSQNQAESLLRAVNAPPPDKATQDHSGPVSHRIDPSHSGSESTSPPHLKTREAVDSVADRPSSGPAVQPYDFRAPPQLRRDQVQALHVLSDVVAMQFSRSVSTLMRGEIDCQLMDVDQCRHQDFVCQMDDPSCYCVIEPRPLSGQWMLDIPSKLLFAMIDRMLGGEPFPDDSPQRPMTDIEKRLIGRVVDKFLDNVSEAWQQVIAIHPVVASIENHPHCVASASPNESVVRVRYSATISSVRGEFWLAIPISTIDHLSDRMNPESWENEMSKASTEASRQTITQQLADAPINVVVNLAKSTISTRDLLGLSVGDVIATEKPVAEPMELAISNVPKFNVRAGAFQKKVAVQIESTVVKH